MDLGAQSMVVLVCIAVSGMASGVFVAFKHRDKPGSRGFIVAISGAAGWSLMLAIDMVAHASIPLFVSITVRSLFVFALSLGWLLFVVEYIRHETVRLMSLPVALLLVIPVVSIGLTLTNPLHNFVLAVESIRGPSGGLDLVYGPWYYVYLSYTYLVTLPGVGLLVLEYRSANDVHRRQLLLIIGGFAIAFVGASDYLLFRLIGDVPSYVRLSPFAYLVTTGLWLVALFRHQLFDFVPISRWTVVETLSDPIVAVDSDGMIADSNPAAKRLGASTPAVGTAFEDFFAGHPTLIEQYRSRNSTTELELTHNGASRQYLMNREPIATERGGVVIILRDITALKQREQQLILKNEQLERLANVVSHDLQTPILTAQKLLTVLRMDLSDVSQDGNQSLDNLEAVHDRLAGFADNLPRLARESTDVEEPIEWELTTVANAAWGVVDTGSLSIEIESTRTFRGDPARVQQVFENLFHNTVKHATSWTEPNKTKNENQQAITDLDVHEVDHPATTVRVGAYPRGFFIEDDGPGIDPDLRAHVLEYGMSISGESGFGLAIVRSIVEAHGWEISVTESSTGGARFEIQTSD